MNYLFGSLFFLLSLFTAESMQGKSDSLQLLERNKEIARNFYQDLWFTNNTDAYEKYVAEEYFIHDIGDRKDKTEPAVKQKKIADFFWTHTDMSGEIDYQIAEGDLVATRWVAHFKPKTLFGRIVTDEDPLHIINVFRFNEEGKIVEIWNHRHDIDTPRTLRFTLKGLLIGLAIALIPTFFAIRYKRRLNRMQLDQ